MSEADLIRTDRQPHTVGSLTHDLRALGVASGDTVLVHCSLRAIGWVSGGPSAVIQALCDAVAPGGTVMMPAQSGDLTDPAGWEAPPVPPDWQQAIRESMPAFDRHRTPTRDMGRTAELFRSWPGVLRSDHPACSFCAVGRHADIVVATQPLRDPFGTPSPLSALGDLQGYVLMLGAPFESCTALHHAERLAWPDAPLRDEGSPLFVEGRRQWVRYRTPTYATHRFAPFGRSLSGSGIVRDGMVGSARSALIGFRDLIGSAVTCRSKRAREGSSMAHHALQDASVGNIRAVCRR